MFSVGSLITWDDPELGLEIITDFAYDYSGQEWIVCWSILWSKPRRYPTDWIKRKIKNRLARVDN